MNPVLLSGLRGLTALVLAALSLPVLATQAYYIHADHLNTPRLIEDQSQQVVWRWDNDDPFGGNMANANPSGLGAFECNLRFPGQYFDKETNQHYNYFRDYSPEIGRYIESDPIGLAGGINTYVYVLNAPISQRDPFGLLDPNPRGGGSDGSGGVGRCHLVDDKTLGWTIVKIPPYLAARKLCTYVCTDACTGRSFFLERRPTVFNPPWKCSETLSRRDI